MSAHTPGPWSYEPDNRRNPIVSYEEGYIARLFSPEATVSGCTSNAPPLVDVEANARLIAAAPDMYAALRDILAIIGVSTLPSASRRAREALDKAEGI